jgi:hypothetical protein
MKGMSYVDSTSATPLGSMPCIDSTRERPLVSMDDTGFFKNNAFGRGHMQIAVSTDRVQVAIKNTALGSNNWQFGGHVSNEMLQQWLRK